MKVSVIGCGRWGSFIAWYLNTVSHQVTLYGRKGSKNLLELMQTGKNQYVTLDQNIELTDDLDTALASDYIFISISAQGLRGFLEGLKDKNIQNKAFILSMKGLEQQSGKRLTEVFSSVLPEADRVAVWVGPGHIQDFTAGVPNCMVITPPTDPSRKSWLHCWKANSSAFTTAPICWVTNWAPPPKTFTVLPPVCWTAWDIPVSKAV